MPTYYASGASDDLCHFYGDGIDEEYGAFEGRKHIALSSSSGGVTHIHWLYQGGGTWAVFPALVDHDTSMVPGVTFTTSVHDDPDYSMILEIRSPEPLTVTEVDRVDAFDPSTVPFPKFGPGKKKWPRLDGGGTSRS